jgi:hypothetical protein
MRHLSLVSSRPATADEVAESAAYVPVKLLLAASGRCSCDECCQAAVRSRSDSRSDQVRPARGTDRQPVRNIHLLS